MNKKLLKKFTKINLETKFNLKIQVSKNRHVGYGIRYACTRNAKARDNCPYLLLHIPGKFLNNPQLK